MRTTLAIVLALGGTLTGWAVDSVRTLAGAAQTSAHADGLGAKARFSDPTGLAVDAQGNVFIADSANHSLRKLTPAGTVTTIAGRPGDAGNDDGPSATARFDTPSAVALAKDGTLFISDTGNHTIRRLAPNGAVSTLAGFPGDAGPTNALGRAARFNLPLGLALAQDGGLFVADSGNSAIRRVAPNGTVTTFAGVPEDWGAVDGKGGLAKFNGPVGLVFDQAGNLFVSDSLNHALRRIAPDGTVTTFAGKLGESGFADGPATEARFGKPAELAFDARGDLYVVDAFYHTLRKVAADGTVATVAGLAGTDGDADGGYGTARFFNPYGLVVAPSGSLVVSDAYNQLIRGIVAPFTLSARRTGDGGTVVRWESFAGRQYRVLYRDSLTSPWQTLGAAITASGDTGEVTDSTSAPARFYQVERLD